MRRAALATAVGLSAACSAGSAADGADGFGVLDGATDGAADDDGDGSAGDSAGDVDGDHASGGAPSDCAGLTACGVQCVDLDSDPDNCGACGVSCVIANGLGSCSAGVCGLAACDEGFGNCDGIVDNGCETAADCVAGSACETTCGSTGQLSCADACAPTCLPIAETCNAVDDDCNGACDEGAMAGCRQGVHRSNSPTLGHFYTLDEAEASSGDYNVEALNFYFTYVEAIDGLVPLYRCLRPNGKRFYTKSAACEGAGTAEGHVGHVAPEPRCGSTELYRLYNPGGDSHFYTISAGERDNAVASGWVYETVIGYVWTEG